MKTRMPFGGFFLKLLDEQNGTCEYEEYQRKCEEEPLTEEEQKEQAEQVKAVNKELERRNAESEQNKPEVVPKQQLELIPAETMRWSYASELIGNEFRHWGERKGYTGYGNGLWQERVYYPEDGWLGSGTDAAWGQQQSHSVPLLADDSKRGAKKSAQRGSLSCFWTRDGG